jgi:hypothetical protein
MGNNIRISSFATTIEECAGLCRLNSGCRFVNYHFEGSCIWNLYFQTDCPDGFEQFDGFGFYEVLSGDDQPQDETILVDKDFEYEVIRENFYCKEAERSDSTYVSIDECAERCFDV